MSDASEPKPAQSPVVRLRGLPYCATEEDIAKFFGPEFEIVCTHICKRNGRATGEAYCQFNSDVDAGKAMAAKNSQYMGHRYIEIFEALEGDIAAKKAVGGADLKLKGHVVRMRGLPFTATPDEIVDFFEGLEVSRGAEGVVFTRLPDGRPSGEAYVEFPSAEVLEEAMQRHKAKLGPRYIELFASSKGDMLQALHSNGYHHGQQQGERRGGRAQGGSGYAVPPHPPGPPPTDPMALAPTATSDGSTLELRGLPFSAEVEDITEFFADFGIADKDVQLPTKHDYRTGKSCNTGYAYVRFPSAEDATRARETKHCAVMGTRYIECLPYAPRSGGGGSSAEGSRHSGRSGGSSSANLQDEEQRAGAPGSQAHAPKVNGRGHAGARAGVGPLHLSQQRMMAPEYAAAAQQQQMFMQQHYMMQQQAMMQQQMGMARRGPQAVRGYDAWTAMPAAGIVAPGQAAPAMAGGWYKGAAFHSPGMVYNHQSGTLTPALGPIGPAFGPAPGFAYGMAPRPAAGPAYLGRSGEGAGGAPKDGAGGGHGGAGGYGNTGGYGGAGGYGSGAGHGHGAGHGQGRSSSGGGNAHSGSQYQQHRQQQHHGTGGGSGGGGGGGGGGP